MRVPSAARIVDVAEWRRRRSTKPEGAGSTPAVDTNQLAVAQRSRAPRSEGGGRTFESCRRDASLLVEAIRPDEEPVSKTGRGREALVGASPTASSRMPRWSSGQDAGPSTRRPGFESPSRYSMPGSRAERRPAVTRKAGVRARPWQRHASNVQVVVVQRRGSRCATPRMRVRVPPTTRNTPTHDDKEGVTCPPTSTTSSSPGRARSTTETIRQAEKTARLPIVEGHVALMPDAHVGIGATVGSVIPTKGAVIPAAVGVDIGCGMIAAELDVTEDQLPDSLEPLLGRIEQAIPAGVGQRSRPASRATPTAGSRRTRRQPSSSATRRAKAAKQFGTLGSGNHFFELCVDERAPGVGGAALGQPRHRQQARARCTSTRRATSPRTSSCGSRTRTSRTSSRARRSSTRTSPTCCGRRSTPGRTVTR